MASDNVVRNWNITGVVAFIATAAVLIIWRAHHAPLTADTFFQRQGGVVADIANDQLEDAWLFINWTVADWLLTLLAAGTAIGAAVKNAFSAHNQAKSQAAVADAKAAGTIPAAADVSAASSNVDKWVMVLAALTIAATTLDTKIHAGVQADRYRQADLLLQEALADYKANMKQDLLLASWHRAQKILEGIPPSIDTAPKDANIPSAPAANTNTAKSPPPASPTPSPKAWNATPPH
jgi:hypothetical protein